MFVFPRWCTIHAVTFLFLAENMRNLLKKSTQHKDLQSTRRSGHHSAETCVTQPSTSFVERVGPSTPPVAGPSKRLCKGFGCCTQHAQQWSHAARTLPRRATGASRALAVAKMDRNVALWTIGHHCCAQDDQAGPAVLFGQFRVSSGLLRSGNIQSLSIDGGGPCTSSAVATNWGDHGGVDGKLRAIPQR